jgi:sec-independent protein translocase protein TatA
VILAGCGGVGCALSCYQETKDDPTCHWSGLLIIALIVLLIFGGRGKLSSIMGDMGKGITSFKKGLKDGVEDIKDASEDALDVTPPKAEDIKVKKKR